MPSPSKFDLIAHMANLTFIFDHHERLGTTKNNLLMGEYHQSEKALNDILQKEKDDEARQSQQQSHGIDKDGASLSQGEPRGGVSTGRERS